MPIRYIHNDPGSVPYLESVRAPRQPRAGQLARFNVSLPDEEVYGLATPEFVDRQCYEAALCTLAVWERVATPFRYWHNRQRSIALKPRRETGYGASYERNSIGFDFHPLSNPGFFVGASTDAVSHEVGHAILDALRPELWDSLFAEVAAFHEGFADCMSLLVALLDDSMVSALFNSAPQPIDVLSVANTTSQVAESVAKYSRKVHGPQNAASVPRRLRNSLQWSIPGTLPANPVPGTLSREPHSFGQVIAGCFYDCVNNIYRDNGSHDPAGLRDAALTAGAILASAITSAPEQVRFFRAMGRTMIHADKAINGGSHHAQISAAFLGHNVQLGSAALLAPAASLDGPPPARRGAAASRLNARTRNDLVRKAGMDKGARVSTSVSRVGSESVVRARLRQPIGVEVRAADGSPMLVNAQATQDVLLSSQRGGCVVLGDMPNHYTAEEEVNVFLDTLLTGTDLASTTREVPSTHAIFKRGQGHVLRRTRFSCCHRGTVCSARC